MGIFLVLDVEGHEAHAIDGIKRYRPHKVFMEGKHASEEDKKKFAVWAKEHNLDGRSCTHQDLCYNYDKFIGDKPDHIKSLFYGARNTVPAHDYKTSVASEAYMFYGT